MLFIPTNFPFTDLILLNVYANGYLRDIEYKAIIKQSKPIRMKTILLSVTILFMYQFSVAQLMITGNLEDTKGEALGFANVLLLNQNDSSFVAGTTTNIDGDFNFMAPQSGDYLLLISMIGYTNFYSEKFTLNSSNTTKSFSKIILQEGGIELAAIEVTAEKPLFERQIDRTVINLENRVSTAGATALEVLERAPGVIVDRSSNALSMMGKEGVNVMINDRLSYMPPDALIQFLEGMSADNIISIELITTPPAKFDAEGNAGYINIILKKNPNDGLNGNYAVTAGYGRGEIANGSLNFNYRKERINLFGGYNYSRDARDQSFTFASRFGTGASLVETTTSSDRTPLQSNHNARIGLDFESGDNTTIGILFSGYDNRWNMSAVNDGTLKTITGDTISQINMVEDNNWQHFQTNLNVEHKFKNGGKLNIDADYLVYENENPTNYDLRFQDGNQTLISNETLFSTKVTPFTIQVGQIDYENNISEKINLSVGVKAVQSDFENDVLVKKNDIEDSDFTSTSSLTENIYAAYAQGRFQINEKLGLQTGLRYEFTDTELNSSTEGKVVDREFGSLFPSVYADYKINDNNQINASYSRRIDRPSFSNMAPFIIFVDPNTLFGGNAALQPAISNSVELNYRFKTINLSMQYTHEDSSIAGFQSRFDVALNRQIIAPINLQQQQMFTTSVSFPVKVTDWWNMRLFGMYFWKENITVDNLGTQVLSQGTYRFNGNQTFTLSKGFNLEVSGFYTSPFINGNLKINAIWGMNFGIQKELKNGRIAFNIGDVFNSIQSLGITNIPSQNIYSERGFDFSQRTFRLTYSASFGNNKVKRARNRNSSDEERGRVN